MEESKKYQRFYLIIGIATLVVAVIGATFAYFSASVNGNGTPIAGNTLNVTGSNLTLQVDKITYSDIPNTIKNDLVPADVTESEAGWQALLTSKCVDTTAGYTPSKYARQFVYDWADYGRYELTIEPTTGLVLREMAGILTASGLIVLLLGLAFHFLIRTIIRQRTLDEMKTDFTNNITHELKTPIAVAYAANDALLNFGEQADEAKRRHYLTLCRQQLERLSGMVEQILSMSMERRRQFKLNIETLNLSQLLQPVIEQQQLKADKPVVFTTRIEPEDLTVHADRAHLSNILNNLIDNAIKYSPGEAHVEITATPSAITITDHGMGIATDKLPHIYDKFYRVPTGDLHDVKGYGLGLFYVKTMVEKHGWSIDVSSVKGEGTTFTIILI